MEKLLVVSCFLVFFTSHQQFGSWSVAASRFTVPPGAPQADGFYYVVDWTKVVTWQQAKTLCEGNGGSLASPRTLDQYDRMHSALRNAHSNFTSYSYVFDAQRKEDRVWRHLDGSPLAFHKWLSSYPSATAGYDCLYFQNAGMNNYLCSGSGYYTICSYVFTCDTSDIVIENSQHKYCNQADNITHGTEVSISCLQGYSLQGPSSIKCDFGNWTSLPTCNSSCSPPEVAHPVKIVEPRSVYFEEEEVVLICSGGYFVFRSQHPQGYAALTCKGLGVWDPPVNKFSTCRPEREFQYSQKSCSTNVTVAKLGTSLTLPCDVTSDNYVTDHSSTSVYWIKDQKAISKLSFDVRKLLTVKGDRSLTVTSFTADLQGVYYCVAFNKDETMNTGKLVYAVKLQPECVDSGTSSASENLEASEGKSIILTCPAYNSSESSALPIWYKDGARVWNDGTFLQLADGSLFLKSVSISEEGDYVCQAILKNDNCQVSSSSKIVVHPSAERICGVAKSLSESPWLVSLWRAEEESSFCYGVLVNERWVVTLATCLIGIRKVRPGVSVTVGANQNKQQQQVEDSDSMTISTIPTVKMIPVEYVVSYESFSPIMNNDNVGLAKLDRKIKFTSTVRPVCLPYVALESELTAAETKSCQAAQKAKPIVGSVSGFGSLKNSSAKKNFSVDYLTLVSPDLCQTCSISTNNTFCTERKSSTTNSTLPADMGSPFTVVWKERSYLFGVHLMGKGQAATLNYDYFLKVGPYISWIKKTAGLQ